MPEYVFFSGKKGAGEAESGLCSGFVSLLGDFSGENRVAGGTGFVIFGIFVIFFVQICSFCHFFCDFVIKKKRAFLHKNRTFSEIQELRVHAESGF